LTPDTKTVSISPTYPSAYTPVFRRRRGCGGGGRGVGRRHGRGRVLALRRFVGAVRLVLAEYARDGERRVRLCGRRRLDGRRVAAAAAAAVVVIVAGGHGGRGRGRAAVADAGAAAYVVVVVVVAGHVDARRLGHGSGRCRARAFNAYGHVVRGTGFFRSFVRSFRVPYRVWISRPNDAPRCVRVRACVYDDGARAIFVAVVVGERIVPTKRVAAEAYLLSATQGMRQSGAESMDRRPSPVDGETVNHLGLLSPRRPSHSHRVSAEISSSTLRHTAFKVGGSTRAVTPAPLRFQHPSHTYATRFYSFSFFTRASPVTRTL